MRHHFFLPLSLVLVVTLAGCPTSITPDAGHDAAAPDGGGALDAAIAPDTATLDAGAPTDAPTGVWGTPCTFRFPAADECPDGFRCQTTGGAARCAPACESMSDCTAGAMGICATIPLGAFDAGTGLGNGSCVYYCELGGMTYGCPEGTACGAPQTGGFRICEP